MAKTKNCEWCGKKFVDKHRDGKRFCSMSCAGFYRGANYPNGMSRKTGELNPNWRGGNERKCCECGVSFVDAHYSGRRFCSRSCAARFNHRERMTNERKAERTTGKVCLTCGETFYPNKLGAKYCSMDCYVGSAEFAELQGCRFRGKSLSESAKQAISEANVKRNAAQEYTSGRNGYYASTKAGSVFYRSSYELVAFERLDADERVVWYKPEPLTIEYANESGEIRRYRPDVLIQWVDTSHTLVEIKPAWRVNLSEVAIKLRAGEEYAKSKGWQFEVWTESELGITPQIARQRKQQEKSHI